jgi:hypothetical protein
MPKQKRNKMKQVAVIILAAFLSLGLLMPAYAQSVEARIVCEDTLRLEQEIAFGLALFEELNASIVGSGEYTLTRTDSFGNEVTVVIERTIGEGITQSASSQEWDYSHPFDQSATIGFSNFGQLMVWHTGFVEHLMPDGRIGRLVLTSISGDFRAPIGFFRTNQHHSISTRVGTTVSSFHSAYFRHTGTNALLSVAFIARTSYNAGWNGPMPTVIVQTIYVP